MIQVFLEDVDIDGRVGVQGDRPTNRRRERTELPPDWVRAHIDIDQPDQVEPDRHLGSMKCAIGTQLGRSHDAHGPVDRNELDPSPCDRLATLAEFSVDDGDGHFLRAQHVTATDRKK